ncbi:unnamed protein product [Somion occarium]|uniref:Uncharacterized protein n=1 Tax=Somion occarium TaxID=3059160 RepID=A0ABP1DM76_9APHY
MRSHWKPSWTIVFKFKRVSSPSQTLPLEEIEEHFAHAERERSRRFEGWKLQFEFDFLQAEATRRLPEERRASQSKNLLRDVHDKFIASQKARTENFEAADVAQEHVFQSNEDRRNMIFNEEQATRERNFLDSQEAQVQQAEWYYHLRVQLYADGHKHREQVFNRVSNAISTEFGVLLQSIQRDFAAAQTRRDEIIKKIMESPEFTAANPAETNTSSIHTEFRLPSDFMSRIDRYTPPIAPHSSGVGPPSAIHRPEPARRQRRTRSRVPSIQMAVPSGFYSTQHPLMSHASVSQPPPSPPARSTSVLPMPVDEEVKLKSGTSQSDSTGSNKLRDLLAFQTALFHEQEEKRSAILRDILKDFEWKFKQAENARNEALDIRHRRFVQAEGEMDSQFYSSQRSLEEKFKSREELRDGAESRRTHIFDNAEERFATASEHLRTWFSKRATIADKAEAEFASLCKSKIENTIQAMETTVQDIRGRHSVLFIKTCNHYQDSLGFTRPVTPQSDMLPSLQLSPATQSAMLPSESTGSSMPHRHARSSHAPPPISIPAIHAPLSSATPDKTEGRKHKSERETTFAPRALLQTNGISARLPMPQDENDLLGHCSRAKASNVVKNHIRKHQSLFEKGEASRRKEMKHALQRWQQLFVINEIQRQETFKSQLRDWRDAAERRESLQFTLFSDGQRDREQRFRSKEAERENSFWASERYRNQESQRSLDSRNIQFHKEQEAMLNNAHTLEAQRQQDFAAWEIIVQGDFIGKMMMWKDDFASDELAREKEFMKIINSVKHSV